MLNITVDSRHLSSGIGTYTMGLLHHVPPLAPEIAFTALVRRKDTEYLASLPPNVKLVPVEANAYTLREQLIVPYRTPKTSLFHAPHYNIPLLLACPMIVTIHDLTHLMFSEFLPNHWALLYAKRMLAQAARKAECVVTVSEFTKNEIISRLGVEESKVRVIYPGVTPPRADEGNKSPVRIPNGPYLLYVGNLKGHKNLKRLIRVFAWLRRVRGLRHFLVLAGEGRREELEAVAREERVLDHVCFLGKVSSGELGALYRHADLFIMPSLSEGFGFPALEALSHEVPVVSSRNGSLPEVLQEAALYFDPLDEEDMAEQIIRGLEDTEYRSRTRKQGLLYASRFSWESAGRRYVGLYREILHFVSTH